MSAIDTATPLSSPSNHPISVNIIWGDFFKIEKHYRKHITLISHLLFSCETLLSLYVSAWHCCQCNTSLFLNSCYAFNTQHILTFIFLIDLFFFLCCSVYGLCKRFIKFWRCFVFIHRLIQSHWPFYARQHTRRKKKFFDFSRIDFFFVFVQNYSN